MAKNEAKIKFTAETGGFNDAIKKSNDEMSRLRAEMKLNETQMLATGETVEGLENKHRILSEQLQASQDKTEALSQKLETAKQYFGENSAEVSKLEVQLLNAMTAEEKLRQAVQQCADELAEQGDASEEVKTATESLTDTISEQQKELDKLKNEYKDAVLEYGETSAEAKALEESIGDLSQELKDNKDKLADVASKADDLDRSLDNASDSAESAGDGFTVMKGVVADLASNAIQNAIGKISEFVGWLGQLPAETMEIRQDMATLTTSFDNMGFSTETAQQTWKDLYAVFGEDDRAVEAANNISKMADSQEDLQNWVTITTGVWGTYQDSLPVEGLAEAANETAKVGQVTGVFADALNWSSEAAEMFAGYMNDEVVTAEDAFNVALSECSTEAERQQLITDTLTKLYGDAAETYRDSAGAQMEAKEAAAEQLLAQNNLASAVEPVTTAFTELKTEMLSGLQPAIETIAGAMSNALDWLQEHPVAAKVLVGVIGTLAVAFNVLAVALGVYTVAQWAANSAIAPMILPIMGVVAAIAAVVAIVIVVIEYWDEIVAAVKRCWEAVKATLSKWGTWINNNVIQPVANFFSGLWEGIKNAFFTAVEWIKGIFTTFATWINTNIVFPIQNFFSTLWTNIKTAFTTFIEGIKTAFLTAWEWIKATPIFQFFSELFSSIWATITSTFEAIIGVFQGAWEAIKLIWGVVSEWFNNTVIQPVKNFFTGLWNTVKSAASAAWNGIKSVWNTVKTWFNTSVITPVKNYFTKMWTAIKSAASSAWNGIKGVWNVVKGWFNDKIISPVKNAFSGMWNSLKNGAKSAWSGIKSVFGNVTSWFKDKFTQAWTAVKNVFSTGGKIFVGIKEGIVSAFKTVVNGIIGGINKVVAIPFNAINGVLKKIKNISIVGSKPFQNKISLIDVPQIPMLANGGIVETATLNVAGEAGPEAITPIDKLEGYIVGAVESTMNKMNIQAIADAIEELAERPVYFNLNGRRFAEATASDSDSVNGLRSVFRGRDLVLE